MNFIRLLLISSTLALSTASSPAQLLQNLRSFSNSVSLIDPSPPPGDPAYESDGPKELVSADFDQDGRPDLAASKVSGKVSVVYGRGGKEFDPARFLSPPEGTGELRGITTADFNGDGRPDVAVAAPYGGRIVVFHSGAGRTFLPPQTIASWRGVRNLIAADLDGDGDQDILAAGPDDSNTWHATKTKVTPYYRNGAGFTAGQSLSPVETAPWTEAFPRPVFTMAALPPLPGHPAQRVVFTHALSETLWMAKWDITAGATTLEAIGQTLIFTQSLTTGRVLTQHGEVDLVTAARDANQVLVRGGRAGGAGFDAVVAQRLYLPGAPRAMALADVDADGWNDLLVVLRNYDRVVTFRNEAGTLKLTAESPTGVSPRDLAIADFNGDGRPDLAVANRKSDNLSVLLTQESSAGFERLDSVYPVDGGVSALQLTDLNGDGRADAVLTHMQTNEISVRLSLPGGQLAPPLFTKVDQPPLALRPGDFNHDGKKDFVAVHNSISRPGMSVLLGRGDGMFAPPTFFTSNGRLFSIHMADFDGDGVVDAAAGYYDCRLALYKGAPDGTFALRREGLFTYEARAMTAADFDQDGDVDFAGASAMGKLTIVENDGHLLEFPAPGTAHEFVFIRTDTQGSDKSGIKSMVILDANGDNDPDVAINTSDGVIVYTGGPGLTFTPAPFGMPGTRSATDLTLGDFDGDGITDLATACRLLACVVILKGMPDRSFQIAGSTPVPTADMIAAGDIDGDGIADLAGAGEVIWTALSSRAPQAADGSAPPARPPLDSVVINEVMTSNLTIPLDSNGRTPDFVELYNGKSSAVNLEGWQLRYGEPPSGPGLPAFVRTHTLDGSLAAGMRRLLLCDERNGQDHVNYKLNRSAGTLTLLNPAGETVDSFTWENQPEDVSQGRFSDGASAWVTKSPPDPGQPNYWETSSGPDFRQVSLEPLTVRAGSRPRLYVKAADDAGIFTLSAVWKWLNPPGEVPLSQTSGQVGLFDDGLNGDGGTLDGLFSAVFPGPLPAGAQLEFFIKATNLLDQEETAPGDPIFSLPGQEITNYAFTVPDTTVPVPGLEISEVQTHSAILDEGGEPSDFVELRNTGTVPVTLDGLALRDGLFSSERTYSLTGTLPPGEYRFYYADSDPGQGALHMPFKLSNEGDSVWLVQLDARGVTTILDKVSPPAHEGGTDSWTRLGPRGPFIFAPPTPGAVNLPAHQLHGTLLIPAAPGALRSFRIAMAVPAGVTRPVESLIPGFPWQPAGQLTGNGYETYLDFPVAPSSKTRFFRAK